MRYLTLALMMVLWFAPPISAQYAYEDACKFVDGQYNLGLVNRLVRDPLNLTGYSFYTVSSEAVCHATGMDPSSFEIKLTDSDITFEKVLVPQDVGVMIRDIALGYKGEMAVIAPNRLRYWEGEHRYGERADEITDQKVWFRESKHAPFYEITPIKDAGLGRIEDVWLNGDADVLVAVSTTKVGTWKRVGPSWTLVSVTNLADIGVDYFPSVHDLHTLYPECASIDRREGIQIIGHPRGERVYIDAIARIAKRYEDSECPFELRDLQFRSNYTRDDYGASRPSSAHYEAFGFLIEADAIDWQWQQPVFIKEKWCRGGSKFIPKGLIWDIALDYNNPNIIWGFCPVEGWFARFDGHSWSRVPFGYNHLWVLPWGRWELQRNRIFSVSPIHSDTLYTRIGDWRVEWAYSGGKIKTEIILSGEEPPPPTVRRFPQGGVEDALGWSNPGGTATALILGGDHRLMYIDFHGSQEQTIGAVMVGQWLGFFPHELHYRDRGYLINACMTRDHALTARVMVRRYAGFDSWYNGYKPQREWLELVDSRTGEMVGMWRTDDDWVRCEPPGLEDMIVTALPGRGVRLSTLSEDRTDPAETDEKWYSYDCKNRGGEYTSARLYIYPLGEFRRGEKVEMDVGCISVAIRREERSWPGYPDHSSFYLQEVVIMNEDGVFWSDVDTHRLDYWDHRVMVSDRGDWSGVKFCGATFTSVLLWDDVTEPHCVDVPIPASVATDRDQPTLDVAIANYPNPFTSNTTLLVTASKPGNARLNIYAIDGRTVDHVNLGYIGTGTRRVDWGAHSLPAGVYFVQLVIEGVQSGKHHRLVRI